MTLIGDCGWPLNYVYSCVLNEAMHLSLWVSDDFSHKDRSHWNDLCILSLEKGSYLCTFFFFFWPMSVQRFFFIHFYLILFFKKIYIILNL